MSHNLFPAFIATLEQMDCRHHTILAAVSGGMDSMVMAALLLQTKKYWAKSPYGLAGFDFAIAHVNYQLRGEDSHEDARLVRNWAKENEIPYFEKTIDLAAQLEQQGGNLQNAARQLRYAWFAQLSEEHGFDSIATAHHLQDSVETLLMNFFKGCGMAGLHGILKKEKQIIRPLLAFEKTELQQFAEGHLLRWREDVSNQSDAYLRNRLRHHLLPEIEALFPQATQHLFDNAQRFAEAELLYQEAVTGHKKKLLEKRGSDVYLHLKKLMRVKPLRTLLFELLKPFGLKATQVEEGIKLLNAAPGAFLDLEDFRLVRHQNFLIITPKVEKQSGFVLITEADQKVHTDHFELKIKQARNLPPSKQIDATDLYVNRTQLTFPLILRPWKEGDYFYPFGMQRKKKKVKKLLIDLKMPLHEKEKVWVLESAQKIVWLVGLRADERFRVVDQEAPLVHFSVKYHSS